MADLLAGGLDGLAALLESETSLDELLSVLDEQIPDGLVTDRGDLDELCEPVSDLSDRERLEERKVEEGVQGGVVRSEPVSWSAIDRPAADTKQTDLFLSFRWLMPTLIETLASIKPMRVVGTRMKLDVRR